MTFVVSLDDEAARRPEISGGKAAALARMRSAGLPVPPGFVVTTEASARSAEPVAGELRTVLSGLTAEPADIEAASERIRALLAELPIPLRVQDEILAAYEGLKLRDVAVRSSATAEDLGDASFAGQYDSFLDVADGNALLRRVRDVWMSLYSPRALSYRMRLDSVTGDEQMGVLVQPLVDADASGVIFTCDPLDGREDRYLVDAVHGLGEGLVSGLAESDHFELDSGAFEVIQRRVADKTVMVARDGPRATARVPVPVGRRGEPALHDAQLQAAGRLARSVQELFGDHRDIEFAASGDSIVLLQARPVTAFARAIQPYEFPVRWTDPADEELCWILRGRSPAYRLQQDVDALYARGAERCFRICACWIVRAYRVAWFNGYAYAAAPEIPGEEIERRRRSWRQRAAEHLERGTTFYEEEIEPIVLARLAELDAGRPRPSAPARDHVAHLVRAAQAYGDINGDLHWRMVGAGSVAPPLPATYAEITGAPPIEAASLLQGLENMTTRLVRRLRGLARLAQGDELLREVLREQSYERLTAPELQGREAVRQFRRRLRELLRVYGRRAGHGFGSATTPQEPTWNMEPARVIEIVASYVEADLDELERLERRARRERVNATRRVRRAVACDPELAARFERALFAARRQVRAMEDHNHLMEQCTSGELRESIHRAGCALVREGRIDVPDDVYHLHLEELRAATAGGRRDDLRRPVAERRAERERQAALTPPKTLGSGRPPEVDAEEDDLFEGVGGALEGRMLRGIGASRGRARGRARVVREPQGRPPVIARGEILIAPNAGPNWTPVFPLLGGLVLDGGAAFQHAALVAREYGIPAVIGTRQATQLVQDGDLVTVDGDAGSVELPARPR